MNSFFEYGSANSIPLYNCSHLPLTPEQWSEKDGVSWPILGAAEFIFGLVIEILYIPLILVMLEKKNFSMSCYKIMAFLAVLDFLSAISSCLITGYLSYQGAVFCTHPNLIYISGAIATASWAGSCLTALLLITNRLLAMRFTELKRILFDGNRTFIALIIPLSYTIYFLFFNQPALFTSKFHSWFFDPMIFEDKGAEYINILVLFNNCFIVFATCFLYIFFCCALGAKTKDTKALNLEKCMQIFFQSSLICAVNFSASIICVIMNYIEVQLFMILFTQFMWQMGNAAPVFIYFAFNITIRRRVFEMLGFRNSIFAKKSVVSKTSTILSVQTQGNTLG